MCVCVRACVRVRLRVRVFVCVCGSLKSISTYTGISLYTSLYVPNGPPLDKTVVESISDIQLRFYNIVSKPALLYGSESWTLRQRDKSRKTTVRK